LRRAATPQSPETLVRGGLSGAHPRRLVWLAWSACGLTLVLLAVAIWLVALNGFAIPARAAVYFPFVVVSAIVGALVTSRQPANPVGWLLLGGALLFALFDYADQYAIYGIVTEPGSLPVVDFFIGLRMVLEPAAPIMLLILLPLYFPTGRLLTPRWRWVLRFVLISMVLFSISWATMAPHPDPAVGSGEGVDNPLWIDQPEWLVVLQEAGSGILFFVMLGAAVTSVVLRFVRATGIERQQMKWFAYIVALLLVAVFAENLLVVAIGFEWSFAGFFLAGMPLAIGFAILRYRLYDIDIIINRTLVYGSLTAMLLLVYVGLVASLSALVGSITTTTVDGEPSGLALAVSTLVVVALFRPLRARLQKFIDRRFYRQRYDAARTIADFNARLRDRLDLDALQSELHGTVQQTMQPTHVMIWVRRDPD
jgi:hypothetical protein